MGRVVKGVGKAVKGVGKLIGFDSDAIADAAGKQTDAMNKTAERQVIADTQAAGASQRTQETLLAQRQAADAAQELLNVPVAQADVSLGSNTDQVDSATGRRVKPRDAYRSTGGTGGGGGINI